MTNKTTLYFEESGTANKRSIVFLHGGGVAGWMWRKVTTLLSADYHCLVPDLPEQGKSTDAAPFSMEFAADCVADLIRDHARGGKACVVGMSEGGQVIVSMLSRCPEMIERAVVSSAILRPLPGQMFYTPAMFRMMYRWFVKPFKNNNGWIRLNMHSAAGVGDEYFDEFKKSFQETSESGFVDLMNANMHFRLPDGLEKAALPVLVIAGKMEYRQMKESARDLIRVLPQARGVMLSLGKGSSLAREHNWPLTAPDLFAETVTAWMEDRPLPGIFLPVDR